MDQENKLAEQLCEVFHQYEVDTVVTVLTTLLASTGVMVCNDKEVFLGYVNKVINDAYAETDHSDEPLQ
jgi:hypothetical protein